MHLCVIRLIIVVALLCLQWNMWFCRKKIIPNWRPTAGTWSSWMTKCGYQQFCNTAQLGGMQRLFLRTLFGTQELCSTRWASSTSDAWCPVMSKVFSVYVSERKRTTQSDRFPRACSNHPAAPSACHSVVKMQVALEESIPSEIATERPSWIFKKKRMLLSRNEIEETHYWCILQKFYLKECYK